MVKKFAKMLDFRIFSCLVFLGYWIKLLTLSTRMVFSRDLNFTVNLNIKTITLKTLRFRIDIINSMHYLIDSLDEKTLVALLLFFLSWESNFDSILSLVCGLKFLQSKKLKQKTLSLRIFNWFSSVVEAILIFDTWAWMSKLSKSKKKYLSMQDWISVEST